MFRFLSIFFAKDEKSMAFDIDSISEFNLISQLNIYTSLPLITKTKLVLCSVSRRLEFWSANIRQCMKTLNEMFLYKYNSLVRYSTLIWGGEEGGVILRLLLAFHKYLRNGKSCNAGIFQYSATLYYNHSCQNLVLVTHAIFQILGKTQTDIFLISAFLINPF